jgi:hypothetical protein
VSGARRPIGLGKCFPASAAANADLGPDVRTPAVRFGDRPRAARAEDDPRDQAARGAGSLTRAERRGAPARRDAVMRASRARLNTSWSCPVNLTGHGRRRWVNRRAPNTRRLRGQLRGQPAASRRRRTWGRFNHLRHGPCVRSLPILPVRSLIACALRTPCAANCGRY